MGQCPEHPANAQPPVQKPSNHTVNVERGHSTSAIWVADGLAGIGPQWASDSVIAARAGFGEEFRSALGRVLAAADSVALPATNILQVRVYVTDLHEYALAQSTIDHLYERHFGGRGPVTTVVVVSSLPGGACVAIEALAGKRAGHGHNELVSDGTTALIRLRFEPSDARYSGGLIPGSKAMELFADLETELALREGGDEGLCIAYHSVRFLEPLYVGDFVEATARVVSRGRTSRRIEAQLFKVLSVDRSGRGGALDSPILAVDATATIKVGSQGK